MHGVTMKITKMLLNESHVKNKNGNDLELAIMAVISKFIFYILSSSLLSKNIKIEIYRTVRERGEVHPKFWWGNLGKETTWKTQA